MNTDQELLEYIFHIRGELYEVARVLRERIAKEKKKEDNVKARVDT